MGISHWASQNWFSLVQSAGIMLSSLFAGLAFWLDFKERRNSNTLAVTSEYFEVWSPFFRRPDLERVLNPKVDVAANPVTIREEMFVLQLLVHLQTSREVSPERTEAAAEAVRKDIRRVFSLPIPHAVWEKEKHLQDSEFVEFMESTLNS